MKAAPTADAARAAPLTPRDTLAVSPVMGMVASPEAPERAAENFEKPPQKA
jgi:hypothetical protein